MFIGKELPERAGNQKFQLIPLFSAKHVASSGDRKSFPTTGSAAAGAFSTTPRRTSCVMSWPMPAAKAVVLLPRSSARPSSRRMLRRLASNGARLHQIQAQPELPKLAAFMDEAETDVLAYMGFPHPGPPLNPFD